MASAAKATYNPDHRSAGLKTVKLIPRERYGLLTILGLYLAAGIVWLIPLSGNPGGVLFWRGGEYSDLLISHLPNAAFIRQAWEAWRQVPLWNPMILSGTPFVSDPLAGLWYPPAWVAAIAPVPLTFNVLLWLHLAWSGLGTFRLVRRADVALPGALLSGLAFSGMPKLIGHAGLGHISLAFAVCWTPWVLDRAWAAADALVAREAGRHRMVALAGATAGLVFLLAVHLFGGLRLLALEFLPSSPRQKTFAAAAAAGALFVASGFLMNAI